GNAAGTVVQVVERMTNYGLCQAGVGYGVAQGDVAVGRRVAHEALELAVDHRVQVQVHRTADLAAQAVLGGVGQVADAGAPFAQRGRDGVQVVAQAGGDAHAGNGDATHGQKSYVEVNSPTRRSLAV